MSKELEKDIEKLKKDMGKFRDGIDSTLADIGEYSQEKLLQTKENLKNAIEGFSGMAEKKMQQAGQLIQEKSEKAIKASRKMITQKPITAIAVSFAAGLLAAFLMERRK